MQGYIAHISSKALLRLFSKVVDDGTDRHSLHKKTAET